MPNNEIGWFHPIDESDQWDGFNDPGIETFAGSPIRNLAREVNQNALDAGETAPVIVKIFLHKVATGTIPDLSEFKINLKACYKASKRESTKATIFFKIALEELNKKNISVLEISDYNTTGMKGPCVNETPYYAFMKAKGQSRKDSDTAAGSYGIGKFAPYSASLVRTIFVSTIFQDDSNVSHQYTQGKSILMSHDCNGKRKQGVGFWGVNHKCQPVEGAVSELPDWIQRVKSNEDMDKNKGSKLSVICFDASEHWQEYIAVSAAENFFGAINAEQLQVNINNDYILEKKTICDFFKNEHIHRLIKNLQNEPEQFENSGNYLAALQDDPEVIVEDSETNELGHVQVRILIGEGLPKKVCMLRNGMFISDSLSGLKSFSDFKEFVAVVQCLNDKGNELLRAMEPPKHDAFEPDRLPTKKEQRKGTKALKDLAKWIRAMLKRHARDPVSEVTEIDELKDFFGEEGSDGSGSGIEEINPYGEVKIHAKPIKMKLQTTSIPGNEAGSSDGDDSGKGGGGDSGSGGGDGKGGKGKKIGGTSGNLQKPLVIINNVRAIPSGSRTRKVSFTPSKSGKISIRLMQAGADTDYDVFIKKSSSGNISNGCIEMNVVAGHRYRLNVVFYKDYLGAVKVVANEV